MAQVEDKPGVATRTLKNYIGGSWVDAEGAETIDIVNPATGEPVQIKASKKVAFRAAKELKESI